VSPGVPSQTVFTQPDLVIRGSKQLGCQSGAFSRLLAALAIFAGTASGTAPRPLASPPAHSW